MPIQRVAIVFDNQTRPETTGVYCLKALRNLVDVDHCLPLESARLSCGRYDLYLHIDDGQCCDIPSDHHPSAWWAIDTHLNWNWCLERARKFDYVFAAQKDGADELTREEIPAQWLPLACDPDVHRKHSVNKTIDVSFVGNMFRARAELLEKIRERFPNTFVGQCYFEEMAQVYSASRTVFNRSIRNDINMRVFEALACGSLLVTNDLAENGQNEVFRDGVHLATYRDPEELLDKIAFYLSRESVRERIEQAGLAEVVAKHTYVHRMKTLLATIETGMLSVNTKRSSTVPARSAVCRTETRDHGYFEYNRPELLALIPDNARKVLDIGCGAGRLGESIKARQNAVVVGIECDADPARAAQGRLDQVLIGDIETIAPAFAADFDVIVCGDVIEHLQDAVGVLRRARDWLRPNGVLVASIPNVRHHSVVSSLLAGNWTYESAGLLDSTHLRFYTRRSIESLLCMAGFRILRWAAVPGSGHEEWVKQGRLGEVAIQNLHIRGMDAGEAEEFFVYQYLIVAEPATCVRSVEEQPRGSEVGTRCSRSGPIRFRQDFIRDFEQITFEGAPFALSRFGDGERAICLGEEITVERDGWTYPGGVTVFRQELLSALQYIDHDYFIGISDSCCDRPAQDWFLRQVRLPLEQITFANIFVNWNYRRFRQLDLRGAVVVSSQGGDFTVPEDVFSCGYDTDDLVRQLLTVDRPILVAAGPASAIIIHKYWQNATKKQTIVDVGSAIDESTKGRKTRPYQYPGSRTADLVCRW